MAQQHLWILLLCLPTWPEAAGREADFFVVNGILGESATFSLDIQEPQVQTIALISKSSVAFVTIKGSGMEPMLVVTHKNYLGRIKVSGPNYDLVISDLRMEDAGDYLADINIQNAPATITKQYNLQVYRRLGKPKITQSLMTSVNSTCNVTLTCSVDKEEKNVTYSWSPLGKGNVLQIFRGPESQELNYTCTAWNPVSNSSDSISTQHLCSEMAMGSSTQRTKLLSGLTVLFLLVLALPLVFLIHWCKRRQGSHLKAFTKNSDASSKATIYTYVTASKEVQPAESRIYDEIRHSKMFSTKEEQMNTVYSEVQYFDKLGKASTRDSKATATSSYDIVI
ncbi:SLAM family member 5 isoform X2 [Ochotona princeps]|uniref:SLAM family member 5 isoform X2 n=1 Tax=Ochotona princeps TaxID=9978 RepID=UPI0027149132|nr:SLAM family member 5 isoform X2 [Ochotona princeps]